MKLKRTLIIAVLLALVLITTWEIYWRSQGLYPTINDEKAL